MFQTFLELLCQFVGFGFLLLLGEAAKYWGSDFSIDIFFKTNIKPLFWVLIAGVAMSASVLLPEQYSIFVETIVGGEIETTNMAAFYAMAASFAVVLKSVFGKPTEVAKQEIMFKENGF